jgi:hypothetical protein
MSEYQMYILFWCMQESNGYRDIASSKAFDIILWKLLFGPSCWRHVSS